MNLQQKNKHLMARAGFGISLSQYREPLSIPQAVNGLFPDGPTLPLVTAEKEERMGPMGMRMRRRAISIMQQQPTTIMRQEATDLMQLWFDEMVQTPYPLREKMSLFWLGYFGVRLGNSYADQLLLQELRSNALGSFDDLVKAVVKSDIALPLLDNETNNRQTAISVTEKIYRFFVADEDIDTERIATLANYFYEEQYDIAPLLKKIFTADWFYSDTVAGAIIKSPVDLLAGYQRVIPVTFYNNTNFRLEQVLFCPKHAKGCTGRHEWIDSLSLVLRMQLPEVLYKARSLDVLQAPIVDWEPFLANWRTVPKDELPQLLAGYLVAAPLHGAKLSGVVYYSDQETIDDYIKSLTIQLMELPEYQLC